MNCPNCGAKISKDASFCLKCGVKLYDEEEEEEEEIVEKPRGKYPQQQYPPQYVPPQPFFTMRTVMLFVVIGVILILVGASWIAVSRSYDYDKYYEEDNSGLPTQRAKDYQKEVAKAGINAISYGAILMILGFFIAGIFLLLGGMQIKDLENHMKVAMMISASLMFVGISQAVGLVFSIVVGGI